MFFKSKKDECRIIKKAPLTSSDNKVKKEPIDICLAQMSGVSFIIPYPSGINYSNKAGGYACKYPSIEGFLVPFGLDDLDSMRVLTSLEKETPEEFTAVLHKYFTSYPWGGRCDSGLEIEDADNLDKIFQNYHDLKTIHLHVDRSKLTESMEAWIYVTFDLSDYDLLKGITANSGILTFPNSD